MYGSLNQHREVRVIRYIGIDYPLQHFLALYTKKKKNTFHGGHVCELV
jgi:hypothetical protein